MFSARARRGQHPARHHPALIDQTINRSFPIARREGGNEYSTGEFTVLDAYAGAFDYYVPNLIQNGFAVVAKSDARAFLDMVASANGQFVVVQSAASPKAVNYVAIYNFKLAAIAPLLACAKERVK